VDPVGRLFIVVRVCALSAGDHADVVNRAAGMGCHAALPINLEFQMRVRPLTARSGSL
jgi:hypothetical protein